MVDSETANTMALVSMISIASMGNARNGYWTHFVVIAIAMKDQSADNTNAIATLTVRAP